MRPPPARSLSATRTDAEASVQLCIVHRASCITRCGEPQLSNGLPQLPHSLLSRKRAARTEGFLDSEQLVVFGRAVAAAGGARLDLAGARGNREVGDGGVFCFARSMRDDRRVIGLLG